MGLKSNHFKEGCTNGHPAVIIPVKEYLTIIGNYTCMYDPPVDINTYNPTTGNVTSAVRAVKEAEWKRKITALKTFDGACAGSMDLIVYRLG